MVSINIFGSSNNNLIEEDQIGTSNDQSFTIVQNNIPQMKFSTNQISFFNDLYMEKDGGYMGMLSLKANKEFGLMLGSNTNMITWKNMTAQPIRFTASIGFLFIPNKTIVMTVSALHGIQAYKNIDMGIDNRIINLQNPVNYSDCSTKGYCDTKVQKTGDTMTGNLYFDGSTRNIHIGCNNLGADKYYRLYLGTEENKINTVNNSIYIFSERLISFNVSTAMNIIVVDSGGITFSKSVFMNDNFITGLATPHEPRDAVNKQYVDSKYEELNARLQRLERSFK
jgi:hypothetical protein